MANYPQAPTLFEFAQKSGQLDEIARRRAIDEEAARRSLQLQQMVTKNQLTLQNLAQNLGNAQLTGLLQKQLDSGQEELRTGQQDLQDFLMAPERQPDYRPQKKGLGGFLQRAFTPQVERGYSVAQQGLLANTLAGQPVQGTDSGMMDFRPPEEREKSQLTQATAQYRKSGGYGGRGGKFVRDAEGNYRVLQPGEEMQPGDVPVNPGTERAVNKAADASQWEEAYGRREARLRKVMEDREMEDADIDAALAKDKTLQFYQSQIEALGGEPSPKDDQGQGKPGPEPIKRYNQGVLSEFPEQEQSEASGVVPASDYARQRVAQARGFQPPAAPTGTQGQGRPQPVETETPPPVEFQPVQGTLARVAPGEMAGSVPQASRTPSIRPAVGQVVYSPDGRPYRVTGYDENGKPIGEEVR